MWWLTITEIIVTGGLCLAASIHYVHMLQLESYQLDGYIRWQKKNPDQQRGWTMLAALISALTAFFLPWFLALFGTGERAQSEILSHMIALAILVAFVVYYVRQDRQAPQKKPLVITKRVRRLLASEALTVTAVLLLWLLIFQRNDQHNSGLMLTWAPFCLLFAGVPYLPLAAGWLVQPLEMRINYGFFMQAQRKLAARPDLVTIGITGSYGKTSTKYALKAILSVKYRVLSSQGSVNTPMGLSRVINEQLRPEHQIFIAEMGSRHVGDIRELCTLVSPRIGLLTSVGPQHLETFHDVDTVARAKYELIEGLQKGGAAFFSADDGWVDQLYAQTTGEKYRVGIGNGLLSMYAKEIEVGPFGSRFTLCEMGGQQIRCETRLLGTHNIQNIVLSAAVARKLSMSLEEIAAGIRKIAPVEHRLQLIQGPITVIDDAFNSNPVGAERALQVLRGFAARHIIVTPGFVELGKEEETFNQRLGRQIADTCDVAVLVGPVHTKPIARGLLEAGFDRSMLFVVRSLQEAQEVLKKIGRPGDVVLFENDLPDNYSEA